MHVFMQYADSEGLPVGRLNLWRRLSIALGASKGKPISAIVFIILFSFGIHNTHSSILIFIRNGTSS